MDGRIWIDVGHLCMEVCGQTFIIYAWTLDERLLTEDGRTFIICGWTSNVHLWTDVGCNSR
jgi:hypothetical protein